MYRRRISNRELSGPYAHLNGKRLIWEESLDAEHWEGMGGTIKRVGHGGERFFVEDAESFQLHWVDPSWAGRYRNIKVIEGQPDAC